MSFVAEITDVFAALASYLQALNSTSSTVREGEEKSLDLAISKLSGSLNLDGEADDPTVQFLGTALSLMCFTAPQVFDSVIERLVKTIVAALSSSVGCKLLKFQNAEALQIGSSISERDCGELIEACTDVLVKLNENDASGMHSHVLLDAVIRATFAASRYQYLFPMYPVLDAKPARCSSSAVFMLLDHLPQESCLNKDEVPQRLLLWYIDPLVLKHDLSEILRETIERPFLCLDQEFHERTEWRMIVMCLMFCPLMFIETRALLHKWFLETGAAPILELLVKLVAVMLDVSLRPTWWSISSELGLKLPFSDAYFPFKHHLYRTLSGPITSTSFIDLVHSSCSVSVTKAWATKLALIDHKSAWALAITFPTWYCYASMTLFCGQAFEDISWKTEKAHNMEHLPSSMSAAMYISWILDPINETQQELIVDFLIKSSESWIHQQSTSGGTDQETAVSRKKLKKPKSCNNMKNTSLRGNLQSTVSWLEKFENVHETFWSQSSSSRQHCTVMFQNIPLGILVGWPGDMNGNGCELLLYYAATGRIFQSKETRFAGPKDLKKDCLGVQESASWIDECNREDVLTGACLVFRLTNIVESMSESLFETEESRINFVCKFKGRAYSFLVKCIKRLMIELDTLDDGPTMKSDLWSRLSRWKNEGSVSDWKDLDDIIARLNQKVSAT